MTPRDDDDKGNFDDTELPDGREHDRDSAKTASDSDSDSGSFDDTELPDGREHDRDSATAASRRDSDDHADKGQ